MLKLLISGGGGGKVLNDTFNKPEQARSYYKTIKRFFVPIRVSVFTFINETWKNQSTRKTNDWLSENSPSYVAWPKAITNSHWPILRMMNFPILFFLVLRCGGYRNDSFQKWNYIKWLFSILRYFSKKVWLTDWNDYRIRYRIYNSL